MNQAFAMPSPNLIRAFNFVAWLLKTVVYALFAPWVVVASAGVAAWLLGASVSDVRETVVSMATSSSEGWSQSAVVWMGFIYFGMCLTVFVRVVTSPLMHSIVERAGVVSEDWFKRAFPNARVNGNVAFTVGIAVAGVWLMILFWTFPSGGEMQRKFPQVQTYDRQSSVALHLKDGTVKGGNAEVVQNPDGSYLVTFKK